MCISSGAIGFSLISILPYEIPLFLRVLIAFLFLGIPLLDSKKIVLFGIAGGVGFFIKDYFFWNGSDFGWVYYLDSPSGFEIIIYPLLTGVMIGIFLSIALWNRKAIIVFPFTGAVAMTTPFNDLVPGLVFGAGMYYYLSSLKKTITSLRTIPQIIAILYIVVFVFLILIGIVGTGGHPPLLETTASIGEVVEKEGIRMTVTNYTFLQNNTVLKVGIMIQNTNNESRTLRDIYLWYKQDEHLGEEILTKHPVDSPKIIEPKTTVYYYLLFENLPGRLRTKDHAVVWEIWIRKGADHVIWRTK